MKYILEIKPEYEDSFKGVMILGATKDSNLFVDTLAVENLEELNSDYINEHYGQLQDDAYQRGLEDGKQTVVGAAELREKLEYQKGLEDAWEAARKIWQSDIYLRIFKVPMRMDCFTKFSASEAIAKLKAYEEKQKADDKIEVGDIIANDTEPKLKVWVTCFDVIGFCGIAITDFGTVDKGKLYAGCSPKGWHKIGHFDIAKILEAMKA